MKSKVGVGLALAAGAIAGVLVLGIFGRIVFSLLALVIGDSLNFSVLGIFQVLILSGIVGAAGGAGFLWFRKNSRISGVIAGLLVGLVMFALMVIISTAAGFIAWGAPVVLFTVVTACFVFAIYGVGTNWLVKWLATNSGKNL